MPDVPKKKGLSECSDDQQERGYYYDDAHGYERYDPETDDDGEADRSEKKPSEDDPA